MKKFLVFLVVLAVAFVAVGMLVPSDYTMERAIEIQAPPERVHEFVGHLDKWPEWTPWAEEDPELVVTVGPISTGVGATQSWSGKDGDGDLVFTKCDPALGVAFDMAFVMEGDRFPATSEMRYSGSGTQTTVTWTMEGDWKGSVPAPIAGWMKIFTPLMMGGMFDSGLSKLKDVAEAAG